MEYINKTVVYLKETVSNIQTRSHIETIYSYTGNMFLRIYSIVKSNYPVFVNKTNDGFMYILKWFVEKKMGGDYSTNKYVKYVYERFNNDEEYIECVEYKPYIKMEMKIVNSEKNINKKTDTNNTDAFIMSNFNTRLSSDGKSLIIFHKIINKIQYHRIFSSFLWENWKQKQNTIYSVTNDIDYPPSTKHPESFYISNVFQDIKIVSPPFIFAELVYESSNEEWVTIMLYENIKRICVPGNNINHDSLKYICMKYHYLNIEELNYKLNVLFPKTESITEYTRDRLNVEPIVIS